MREECKDRSQPRGIPQQRSGQSTSAFVGSRSWVPPEIHPPLSLHPSPATSSRHGGDPDTVETVDQSVRSYSPSPYRFPIFLTALCSSPSPHRGANVTRTFKRINGMRREEGKRERRNRSVVFLKRYLFLKKKRNSSLPS